MSDDGAVSSTKRFVPIMKHHEDTFIICDEEGNITVYESLDGGELDLRAVFPRPREKGYDELEIFLCSIPTKEYLEQVVDLPLNIQYFLDDGQIATGIKVNSNGKKLEKGYPVAL